MKSLPYPYHRPREYERRAPFLSLGSLKLEKIMHWHRLLRYLLVLEA